MQCLLLHLPLFSWHFLAVLQSCRVHLHCSSYCPHLSCGTEAHAIPNIKGPLDVGVPWGTVNTLTADPFVKLGSVLGFCAGAPQVPGGSVSCSVPLVLIPYST